MITKPIVTLLGFLFLFTMPASAQQAWVATGDTADFNKPRFACSLGAEPLEMFCSSKNKSYYAICYDNPDSGNCMDTPTAQREETKVPFCVYMEAKVGSIAVSDKNPGNVYLCDPTMN